MPEETNDIPQPKRRSNWPRARYNHSKCITLCLLGLARDSCHPPIRLSLKDISEISGLNYHSLQTAARRWVDWKLISAVYDHGTKMNVYRILSKGIRLLDIHKQGYLKINRLGKPVYYQVDVLRLVNGLGPKLKSWVAQKLAAGDKLCHY